jgi:multiple sugar transport system permease protein
VGSRLAWENFQLLFQVMPILRYLLNTIAFCVGVSVIQVAVCSLSAYAFARLHFRGRDALFLVYLATLMVPVHVTVVPLFIMIRSFHLGDTFAGLILPSAFTAFGTFLLRQFFLTIPTEYEDSATIDGCNRFASYFYIILPMAKTGLGTLFLFTFVNQWNMFIWPLIISTSQKTRVISVALQLFQGQLGIAWHLIMAATVVAILPSLVLFFAYQGTLAKGIAMSSGFGGR